MLLSCHFEVREPQRWLSIAVVLLWYSKVILLGLCLKNLTLAMVVFSIFGKKSRFSMSGSGSHHNREWTETLWYVLCKSMYLRTQLQSVSYIDYWTVLLGLFATCHFCKLMIYCHYIKTKHILVAVTIPTKMYL